MKFLVLLIVPLAVLGGCESASPQGWHCPVYACDANLTAEYLAAHPTLAKESIKAHRIGHELHPR